MEWKYLLSLPALAAGLIPIVGGLLAWWIVADEQRDAAGNKALAGQQGTALRQIAQGVGIDLNSTPEALAAAVAEREAVQARNTATLEALASAATVQERERAELRDAAVERREVGRRTGVLNALRQEYILSHDNLSSGLLAQTEWPPPDWMNGRLEALGENFRFVEPQRR